VLHVSVDRWDVLFPPSLLHPLVCSEFECCWLDSVDVCCWRVLSLLWPAQVGEPEQPPPRVPGAAASDSAAAASKPRRKGKNRAKGKAKSSAKGKGKSSGKGKGKSSGKGGAAGKGGGAAKGRPPPAQRSGKEAKRSSDDEGSSRADAGDDTDSGSDAKSPAATADSDATSTDDDDEDARMALDAQTLLGMRLTNIGNSCYMNAVVQTLFSVPPLRVALLTASLPDEKVEVKLPPEPARPKKKDDADAIEARRAAIAKRSAALGQLSAVALASDVQRLAAAEPKGGKLTETMRTLVSDRATRLPGLRPKQQHDAGEAAVGLLDRMRDSLLFGAQSTFGSAFRFTLVTSIECECGNVTRREQQQFAMDVAMKDPSSAFRTTCSCDLLALFGLWHGLIDFPEGFRCPRCNEPSRAQHLRSIPSPPQLLQINLSRFSNDGSKRRDRISLPLRFSHAAIGNGVWYRFRGVVLHKGTRSTSGHYVCMGA